MLIPVQLEADGPITEMDDLLLTRHSGLVDNAHEQTHWTEYWLADRCVHRSVHVHLKQGIQMGLAQGDFGG